MTPSAFLFALLAIGLWSFLGYLGAQLTRIPAFLVVGISLTLSGVTSIPFTSRYWKINWKILVVGVGGIFGYHYCYFSALHEAPALEANLINYLWPLLIVILSPLFLAHFSLRTHHLLGAVLGLIGVGLIISGGKIGLDLAHLTGYLYAALAALIWACYSLLSKRLPLFPTGAVGLFCLISGILSIAIYTIQNRALLDPTTLTLLEWQYLILLGAGPLGAAFFAWDAGLKRGDPRIIGALSYLTPLFSTLILVFVGRQPLTWVSGIAMFLIVSGAILGSLDLFLPKGISVQSSKS